MKPLVSILMPAYNAEQWIGDAITSALRQDWSPTEIIIVDDGSTDQTRSAAERFASENVRIVTQKNAGAAAARNTALFLSRGDYIQWLDADDLLAPDKISKQMDLLMRSGTRRTLVSSAFGRFRYRVDRARFSPTPLWHDLTPTEWLINKLEHNAYMQTAAWLVSRELTDAAGPWDTRLLSDDDGEYFCRVLLASDSVRFVPEAKMFYRVSGAGGLSHVGQSDRKLEALFLSLQSHIDHLRSLEDSDKVRAVCLKFLQRWFVYFYPDRLDLVAKLQAIATHLGAQLETPKLPWKYSWIGKLFGWSTARWAQVSYNKQKSAILSGWDKALSHWER